MENPSKETTETTPLSKFEDKARQLIHETRGLLEILKSVKGLDPTGKESQLYRITLKRFRDNCLRLASFFEAVALMKSESERDRILSLNGCGWDDAKQRVRLD